MSLLDKIDALLVLMSHSRSKSEQDDVVIRLQAEVNRLHDVLDDSDIEARVPTLLRREATADRPGALDGHGRSAA